jgi:DNA-binding HxlR family transcriptional regulator
MSAMTASTDDSGRITELERQMSEVTRRLASLERTAPRAGAARPLGEHREDPGLPATGPDQAGAEATVAFSGKGQFGAQRVMINQRATLSQVLAADPEGVTRVFAGLASPARLALLRALVHGPCSSQQLREELDDPSAGQLYHHLRELLAAGLVIQPSRSVYAIPPGKVVTVCVAISAAAHLMSTSHQYPPPVQDDGQPPE